MAAERMSWERLLTSHRLGAAGGRSDAEGRSGFHRDYDRIAFSPVFRRLGRKTQVHPLVQNDHVHSRLTHSLEVSIVGRSLGLEVGKALEQERRLPEGMSPMGLGQILQAACLAHDVGNPPFGHAGEDAIQSWFADERNRWVLEGLATEQQDDFRHFEGNAQGFRLVANIEHNAGNGGMQLTCATLGALMKYPWTNRHKTAKGKFGVYQAEEACLAAVAERAGLLLQEDGRYCRHPLAFLAEAADDICYRIIDLEDAVEMGVLPESDIRGIFCELSGVSSGEELSLSHRRAKAIGRAVQAVVSAFIEHEEALLRGGMKEELIALCPDDVRAPLDEAKQLAHERIFNDFRKLGLELGCYTTLGILLDTFCRACRERVEQEGNTSYKTQRVMEMLGAQAPYYGEELYPALLRATDYISGMTDQYAVRMAQQIGGMGALS